MSTKNFIKLSAAVHELSCSESFDIVENTSVTSEGSNQSINQSINQLCINQLEGAHENAYLRQVKFNKIVI